MFYFFLSTHSLTLSLALWYNFLFCNLSPVTEMDLKRERGGGMVKKGELELMSPPLSFSFFLSFLSPNKELLLLRFTIGNEKNEKRMIEKLKCVYSLNPLVFFGMSFDLVLFHMLLRGHGSFSVSPTVCSLMNTPCRSKHVKWLINLFHDRNLIPINETETKSYLFLLLTCTLFSGKKGLTSCITD